MGKAREKTLRRPVRKEAMPSDWSNGSLAQPLSNAPIPTRALARLLRRVLPERIRPIGYLTHLVRTRTSDRVRLGPFAGMRYLDHSFGSAYLPKLLGTYERELAPAIEEMCATGPGLIVNVGAAEGYYAVGLARRNPGARVVAFESVPAGQAALLKMAKLNGLAAQIKVHGRCHPADLEAELQRGKEMRRISLSTEFQGSPRWRSARGNVIWLDQRPASNSWRWSQLLVCDTEGEEEVLLDPQRVPSLCATHIVVETHDFIRPGVTERLQRRFEQSHLVEKIWQTPRSWNEFPFVSLGTRLIPRAYLAWALSEWRPARMCWLWMKPRA